MTWLLTAIPVALLAPLVVLGFWSSRAQRRPIAAQTARIDGPVRLSQLDDARLARVERLDEACGGLVRRRMLDFGLTPGARVQREMTGPFGSTGVYRVRGTLLALRREQADHVWVMPANN